MKKYRKPNPKEQQKYENAVMAGMKILYADETYPQVIEGLQSGAQTPIQTIGFLVATILRQLQQASPLSDEIVQGAAAELSALLVELAAKEGIFEVPKDQIPMAVAAALKQLAGKPRKERKTEQPPEAPMGEPRQQGLLRRA